MSSDQMRAPGKTKLIKFPPSRAGKDVKCPGYARGDVEASIWLIHNSSQKVLSLSSVEHCNFSNQFSFPCREFRKIGIFLYFGNDNSFIGHSLFQALGRSVVGKQRRTSDERGPPPDCPLGLQNGPTRNISTDDAHEEDRKEMGKTGRLSFTFNFGGTFFCPQKCCDTLNWNVAVVRLGL